MQELVVTAAILATFAALALPSYRSQLIRVRRSEAMSALLFVQAAEEKHRLRTGKYASDLSTRWHVDSAARYDVAVTVSGDGRSYVARATPRTDGGQADDEQCLIFTVDELGTRGVSGPAGPATCWK